MASLNWGLTMSMDALVSTALGIIVSIVLAYVGYRQTIGARQERLRHANEQAVQSAMKILFGGFVGDIAFVLNEFRAAIALEHQVPENSVWSERSLRRIAANRVLNNDVLAHNEKVQTIARALMLDGDGKPKYATDLSDELASIAKTERVFRRQEAALWLTLTALASVVVAIVSTFLIPTEPLNAEERTSGEPFVVGLTLLLGLIAVVAAAFTAFRRATRIRVFHSEVG